MRPFISSFCSREDDHRKDSAPVSCSQRSDETVYLSVLFSRRRSTGRQASGSSFESARRECSRILPELFPWELPLPWAPFTLRQETAVCPEGADPAHGSACAKGADASTSHDAGTSAT